MFSIRFFEKNIAWSEDLSFQTHFRPHPNHIIALDPGIICRMILMIRLLDLVFPGIGPAN